MKRLPGFTIIELLIVIAIIGTLAALGLSIFPGAQKSARDAERKSDLLQYRAVLETFSGNNKGNYVSWNGPQDICASHLYIDIGMTTCIDDPTTATRDYKYVSNGSGSGSIDATEYVLFAQLERTNPANNRDQYFVVCSNGYSGRIDNDWPQSSVCPTNLQP